MTLRTTLLLCAVLALAVFPLFLGGEFNGADGLAAAHIEAQPGFTPWAMPLWTPPSKEIESLIFALQAAFGAGVIGYVIGRRHERAKAQAVRPAE